MKHKMIGGMTSNQTMQRDQALRILSSHKAELEERYGVKKVGIFGSVARNSARDDSDIDIVVEMEPNILQAPCGARYPLKLARPILVLYRLRRSLQNCSPRQQWILFAVRQKLNVHLKIFSS